MLAITKTQYKMKRIIKTGCCLLLVGLAFAPFEVYAQVTADFEIEQQCQDYTKFINTSVTTSGTMSSDLWVISETVSGAIIHETVTKDPRFTFDDSTEYNVNLTAFTENFGVGVCDTTVDIKPTPTGEVEYWDEMVCSNTDSAEYCLITGQGYTYDWDLSGIPNGLIRDVIGMDTHCLKINWGALGEDESPTQFSLMCTIETEGGCNTIFSKAVMLLPNKVPASKNLQVVPKSNDNSILFCIIDNPETYLYKWGYNEPGTDITVEKYPETEDNYFKFDDGIVDSYDCFVEIISKEYGYCTTTVFYNKEKSDFIHPQAAESAIEVLQLYPNPAGQQITLDVLKHKEINGLVSVSVLNFMGNLKGMYKFELPDELNKLTIPTQHLTTGHYLVKVNVADSPAIVKKFIVFNNN